MATSSRIFVKGLPPSITENDFRKHFSFQGRDTTEARLFANRRIGYVGYKTSEDAVKAVKYFNKTFVRMSKIGVELARPPAEIKAPTARRAEHEHEQTGKLSSSHAQLSPSHKAVAMAHSKEEVVQDPKLKEFLDVMHPKQKKRAWDNDVPATIEAAQQTVGAIDEEEQDDVEYQSIPRKTKRPKVESSQPQTHVSADEEREQELPDQPEAVQATDEQQEKETNTNAVINDEDWARSRTSRLLGLLDDEEETGLVQPVKEDGSSEVETSTKPQETQVDHIVDTAEEQEPEEDADSDTASATATNAVRSSMRLFLRNLPFDVETAELEREFKDFGHLEEVHVPLSKKAGTGKGFAYVQFSDPDAAEAAFRAKDGQIFQGRLLHIIPATAKREDKLNDFELSKLPLKKQQQIQRRREAASTQFNWNTLYMNPDAVVSSVAAQLGLAKSDVLDPTSSDAAVKQAHAETHIIQETKSFFKGHGVDLDAFKRSQRGDTAILVKNIPYDASRDDLERMFEEHGQIRRFLMPPSGVIAIVELSNSAQAKAAFGALAYKRLKNSMLFLEKAPKDLFTSNVTATEETAKPGKTSTSELKTAGDADLVVKDNPGTATLFVRNLNFDTTNAHLTETFSPLTGFLSARVKSKTDPRRPGRILSMGFGFVEFRSASDAQAALRTMDGHALHGHKLQVRASHKGADAAEDRRKADQAKRETGHRTKIVIKNLPFEISKKDIRSLFGAYGQLRSVRVPKKMDRAARGFAFADFTTSKEAQSAMDALKDTHLLGRRLVLDFAEEEPADAEAEIEKMAAKVGSQTNAVAVQKLTDQGRKKFTTAQQDDEDY